MRIRALLFGIAFVLAAAAPSRAQVAPGFPPFGSFKGAPDTVDLANLNVHWSIPVLSKAGRGLPFVYALQYDSSIWSPAGGTWQPSDSGLTSLWGWGTTGLLGTMWNGGSSAQKGCNCKGDNCQGEITTQVYNNYVYADPAGTQHNFGVEVTDVYDSCTNSHEILATGPVLRRMDCTSSTSERRAAIPTRSWSGPSMER